MTKVVVSKVTIEKIFSGVPTAIIFEPSRRGDYYVITLEQAEYLFPIQDLQVNQHNLRVVQSVFELLEYRASQGRDFHLVKPAQVYAKNDTWELVKTGILQFDLRGNSYDFS